MQKFKRLNSFCNRILCFFYSINTQQILKLFTVLFFISLSTRIFADTGADLLKDTDATLITTLTGTGKKYLYLSEGIVSLLLYIKTKNVMVLIGIIVVAVFFNIMLKIAGAS